MRSICDILYKNIVTILSHGNLWNKARISWLTKSYFHKYIWQSNHMRESKALKAQFFEGLNSYRIWNELNR